MSNEVFAVVMTAILGPILVLFFSELFKYLESEKQRQERFFYELFPKRLALYEEIIKALDFTEDSEIPFFNCNTAWELSSFYKEKCTLLADFGFRCTMLGSIKVGNHLTILHGFTAESGKLALRLDNLLHNPLPSETKERFVNSFTDKASDIKVKILEIIREETGAEFIDNKLKDFMKNIKVNNEKSKNIS